MHELGIAAEVVSIAVARSGGARVTRILLEIGKLSAVLPDAVRFCFDAVAEGTPVEGARLDILETPGLARCVACAATMELDRPFGLCACGATELEWLAGDELRLREMEVAG